MGIQKNSDLDQLHVDTLVDWIMATSNSMYSMEQAIKQAVLELDRYGTSVEEELKKREKISENKK